jgi:CRP-like cAMP-binding protein
MARGMPDQVLLSEVELFRDLGPVALTKVTTAADVRDLERGDVIFAQGDEADELFVVRDGRIAMANKSEDGRESLIALMERGDLFGEMPLFDNLNRSAEARALERSSILAVPYDTLRAIFEEEPGHLWHVVALLAVRLRVTDEALADSVFLDVTGRTAKRLLELAGDSDEFSLPITQEELAGMVGASRERVNKAIASFIRLGWIQQVDRQYTITNRDQLTIRAR